MAVFDHLEERWFSVGEVPSLEPSSSELGFELGRWRDDVPAAAYRDEVARSIAHIAKGDIFQANIARRMSAPFAGSRRALAAAAIRGAAPWHGAFLELDDHKAARAVVSLSPELFLRTAPDTRSVLTRPIKGTRSSQADVVDLEHSAKDAAELNMIIDLMRSDLGRVCEIGSIRVDRPRVIETHPTVHHGVGEVTGRLRADVTRGSLLKATFPPGSVTGAPKIRAMQVIEELERFERGPYCGAIGLLGDDGSVHLNVSIRTIALEGDQNGGQAASLQARYWAGAGIVADSDPQLEWMETCAKSAVVQPLCTAVRNQTRHAVAGMP